MRVLFIDSLVPSNTDSGRLDSLLYLEAFVNYGAQVDVLTLQPDEEHLDQSLARHVARLYDPVDASNWIRLHRTDYDLAVICRVGNYFKLEDALTEFRSMGGKVIFLTIDLHHIRELRLTRVPNIVARLSPLELGLLALQELDAIMRCDASVVVSQFEQHYLQALNLQANIWYIPLGRTTQDKILGPTADSPELLFVGSPDHAPNTLALAYFIAEPWQQILCEFPAAQLHVAGMRETDFIHLSRHHVQFHGWVDSLVPLYARSWAAIAPLQVGAGLKGKVVDSLAHGVPVLGSRIALEGMPVGADVGVLVRCDDTEAYLAAIRDLTNIDIRNDVRLSALAYANANFSTSHFHEAVAKLLRDVVGSSDPLSLRSLQG